MNINQVVGNNLKKMRELNGFTQDDMAKALGINRSAYSTYESGLREMPYDILDKVGNFLGCETYLLFEESEEAQNELLATAFRLSGLSEADYAEIISFKDLVKTSLKLDRIANEQ